MTTPTAAQRRQLDAHAEAELRFDLDAVMATVDDECEYEWHPDGLGLLGKEACTRMYAAFLPRWQHLTEHAGLRFEVRSEFWNDRGRIREQVAYVVDAVGHEVRHDFVVMVSFGHNGVNGERTYASAALHRLFLGEFYDELEPIKRWNEITGAPPT